MMKDLFLVKLIYNFPNLELHPNEIKIVLQLLKYKFLLFQLIHQSIDNLHKVYLIFLHPKILQFYERYLIIHKNCHVDSNINKKETSLNNYKYFIRTLFGIFSITFPP